MRLSDQFATIFGRRKDTGEKGKREGSYMQREVCDSCETREKLLGKRDLYPDVGYVHPKSIF
jgi:hypothetical protein